MLRPVLVLVPLLVFGWAGATTSSAAERAAAPKGDRLVVRREGRPIEVSEIDAGRREADIVTMRNAAGQIVFRSDLRRGVTSVVRGTAIPLIPLAETPPVATDGGQVREGSAASTGCTKALSALVADPSAGRDLASCSS